MFSKFEKGKILYYTYVAKKISQIVSFLKNWKKYLMLYWTIFAFLIIIEFSYAFKIYQDNVLIWLLKNFKIDFLFYNLNVLIGVLIFFSIIDYILKNTKRSFIIRNTFVYLLFMYLFSSYLSNGVFDGFALFLFYFNVSSLILYSIYKISKHMEEKGEQIGFLYGLLKRLFLFTTLILIIPGPNSNLWMNPIRIVILDYENYIINYYFLPTFIRNSIFIIYLFLFIILFIGTAYHYYKTKTFVMVKTIIFSLFIIYVVPSRLLQLFNFPFSYEAMVQAFEYDKFMILYFIVIFSYVLAIISYSHNGLFGPAEEQNEINLSKFITRMRFPILTSISSVSVIYAILYLVYLNGRYTNVSNAFYISIMVSVSIITIFIWVFIILSYTITNGKTVDYIYKYATINRIGRIKLIFFIGIVKLITMNYLIYMHLFPIILYLIINMVLDIAIGTPIYEFVFQVFNNPDEIDKYIRNKIIFEMYRKKVLLILGAGSVGRSVAQSFIERIIYVQNQMEAFIIGASDIKDQSSGILFTRVRRKFDVIEPRIYFVSGIVVAEPDMSLVSWIGTDPFFGNYGIMHIDIEIRRKNEQERVKFLIPAIIEGIKNKEVNLELIKTAKLVAQTSRMSKVSQRVVSYTEEILQDTKDKKIFEVLNVTSGPTFLYVFSNNRFRNDQNSSPIPITYLPLYATKEIAVLDAYYIKLLLKNYRLNDKIIILGGYMKEITYMIETLLTFGNIDPEENEIIFINNQNGQKDQESYFVVPRIIVVTKDSSERLYSKNDLKQLLGESFQENVNIIKNFDNFYVIRLINFKNDFIKVNNRIIGFIFPVVDKEVDYPWLYHEIENSTRLIWINDLDPNINMTYMVKVFHILSNRPMLKPSVLISARSKDEGEFAYKFMNEALKKKYISTGFVIFPSNITGRKISSILHHGRTYNRSINVHIQIQQEEQRQTDFQIQQNAYCRRHCPLSLYFSLNHDNNFIQQMEPIQPSYIEFLTLFNSNIYFNCDDNNFFDAYYKAASNQKGDASNE